MVACSKLWSLKEKLRKGKSRTCIIIANTEKDKMKISSKCLTLERGQFNGYQNLTLKLLGPLRKYDLIVLTVCHKPTRVKAKPGIMCPINVPIASFSTQIRVSGT